MTRILILCAITLMAATGVVAAARATIRPMPQMVVQGDRVTGRPSGTGGADPGSYRVMLPLVLRQHRLLREGPALAPLGQLGGYVRAVAVRGSRAYVGQGPRLVVLDFGQTGGPVRLAESAPLPGVIHAVVTVGDHAYVAAALQGFWIADLRDDTPRWIGSLASPGADTAVAVSGRHAFVGTPLHGLRVIDVTDPQSPRQVATVTDVASVRGLAVRDNELFVAAGEELIAFNVSNPERPQRDGALALGAYAMDVALVGNRAYLATSNGITAVDVAVPSAPHELGRTLVKPEGLVAIRPVGEVVYGVASHRMQSFDVGTAGAPRVLQDIAVCEDAMDIEVVAMRAVVACRGGGLHALERIGDYVSTETVVVAGPAASESIVAANGYAFIADQRNGLRVVDVRDAAVPREVAASTGSPVWLVRLQGDRLYAVEGAAMSIYDVSSPAAPRPIGRFTSQSNIQDLAVRDRMAYVLTYSGELLAVDFLDPTAPRTMGSLDLATTGDSLAVDGNFAYVGGYPGALFTVDVSEPTRPRQLARLKMPGNVGAVTKAGDLVVARDATAGLWLVNVTDPAAPRLAGSMSYEFAGRALAVGEAIVVAALSGGLRVVDIADPTAPVHVATYRTHATAVDLALDSNRLLVADGEAGLTTFSLAPP